MNNVGKSGLCGLAELGRAILFLRDEEIFQFNSCRTGTRDQAIGHAQSLDRCFDRIAQVSVGIAGLHGGPNLLQGLEFRENAALPNPRRVGHGQFLLKSDSDSDSRTTIFSAAVFDGDGHDVRRPRGLAEFDDGGRRR